MHARQTQAADAMEARQARAAAAAMLDVHGVAELVHCSSRHVRRLADSGRMPRPINLGSLVRWSRAAIEAWIAEGCPPHRGISKATR